MVVKSCGKSYWARLFTPSNTPVSDGGDSDDSICVIPVAVARGWVKAFTGVDPLVLWRSAVNFLSVRVTEQSYDA